MSTQRENDEGSIPAFKKAQLRLATPRLLEPKSCLQIKTDRQMDNADWLEAANQLILRRHRECVTVAEEVLAERLWQCRPHSWTIGQCTQTQIEEIWMKWLEAIVKCGTDASKAREPYQSEWTTINAKILEDYAQCCSNFPESCAGDAGTPQG